MRVREAIAPVLTPKTIGPRLRSTHEGDSKLAGVLQRFVERLPKRVEELLRLHRDANAGELLRAVHQLKGAAGGYGFPAVSELATRVESELKAQRPVANIAPNIDALTTLLRSIEGYPAELVAPEAAAIAPSKEPAAQEHRVLLVDDSPDTHRAVGAAAEAIGAVLQVHETAEAALAAAPAFKPDVIMLDVNLPGTNGFALRRKFAELPATSDTIALLLADAAFLQAIDCAMEGGDRIIRVKDAQELRKQMADAISRNQSRHRINQRARTDELTGLPNHRYLETRLPADLSAARRGGVSLSCLLIDVSELHVLNQEFGRSAGDAALCAVGRVLAREFDGSTIARLRDDQFFVALLDVNTFRASEIADQLYAKLSQIRIEVENAAPTTISCAVVAIVAEQHAASGRELIENATRAMAAAKTSQKARAA